LRPFIDGWRRGRVRRAAGRRRVDDLEADQAPAAVAAPARDRARLVDDTPVVERGKSVTVLRARSPS
jgi:hypothetical protein